MFCFPKTLQNTGEGEGTNTLTKQESCFGFGFAPLHPNLNKGKKSKRNMKKINQMQKKMKNNQKNKSKIKMKTKKTQKNENWRRGGSGLGRRRWKGKLPPLLSPPPSQTSNQFGVWVCSLPSLSLEEARCFFFRVRERGRGFEFQGGGKGWGKGGRGREPLPPPPSAPEPKLIGGILALSQTQLVTLFPLARLGLATHARSTNFHRLSLSLSSFQSQLVCRPLSGCASLTHRTQVWSQERFESVFVTCEHHRFLENFRHELVRGRTNCRLELDKDS